MEGQNLILGFPGMEVGMWQCFGKKMFAQGERIVYIRWNAVNPAATLFRYGMFDTCTWISYVCFIEEVL